MRQAPRRYACFALLLLACCGKYGHRIEEPISGRIPLSEGLRGVRVEFADGDVTFRAGEVGHIGFSGSVLKAADTADQLARLEPVAATLRAAGLEDGVLLLQGPRIPDAADPTMTRLAMQLVVSLPADLALEVRGRAGNLAAIDLHAAVSLESRHGMLNLSRLRGPGRLRGGTGDVIVDGHRGDLDVEVESGKVFAWIEELGTDGIRLVTNDGPIQARLPSNASFGLDAEAVMGKAANDFGVPVLRKGEFGTTMNGSVGAGGPPVLLRAEDGRISLRRMADADATPVPILLVGLPSVLLLAMLLTWLYRKRVRADQR